MFGTEFDPEAEFLIEGGVCPHWSQSGTIVFVTMRLADSIPAEVLERWEREKSHWMKIRGYDENWKSGLPYLTAEEQHQFQRHFNRCREDLLDNGLGRALLRDPANARIVAESLLHFDGERYQMGDFVIMPNHAHLLVSFPEPEAMKKQFDSWLHFTAVQINKRVVRKGKLWQQEPFDHLVRSVEQYEYLREYIKDNPVKAKLHEGEFLYRRRKD